MITSLFSFTITAILLFLSSQSLIKHLLRLLLSVFKSQETALNFLFFLLLPGIFIHEFSHIFSAELLQVHTGELTLKPHLENNHLKLGSAQIQRTDPFRLTLIGTAPFMVGTVTLWLLFSLGFHLNLSSFSFSSFLVLKTIPFYLIAFFGYLTFAITNTMFSSPSDLQAAGLPIIFLLIIFGTFKLTNINIPQTLITYSTNLFALLSTIFFIILILNLLILILLKLLNLHR